MSDGQIIGGRYELNEVVGQGGMATVYRGRDLQTAEIVAIKLLKREVVKYDPDITERFTREGEALRVLNHPNIVKAFGMIVEGNEHYAIMEYVTGGDLKSLLEHEEKLPVKRVLEIALDLADAPTRAHRLKIIHRDIKPANVLLAADGTPRLTDFGIARVGDSAITQTGDMMGTLAYLSPEGCVGEVLDVRTDVWSFGVMLYEMLAGRRPFEDRDGNQAALLLSILSQPIPPLADFCPDAPPALVQLIDRMLAKDRDERLQSVRQIGAYLEDILSGRIADALPEENDTGAYSAVSEAAKTPTKQMMEQLKTDPHISQLYHTTPTPPPTSTPVNLPGTFDSTFMQSRRSFSWMPLIVGGLVVLVIGGLLLSRLLNPTASPTPTAPAIVIEAPAAGEYLILVADLEPIGSVERDAARFIRDDLQRKLENDVPFSPYRLQAYPEVITSADQARSIGEQTGAVLVLWGDDDGTTARLNTQVGSLIPFKTLFFERNQIEALATVRLLMTDVRGQSLAAAVLSAMNIIQTANSNAYDIALNLAIYEQVKPESPDAEGSSIAAYWYRYFAHYFEDSALALEQVNKAIALDGGNPVLYLGRDLTYIRMGRVDDARRDVLTAARLLPETSMLDEQQLGQIELFINDDPQAAIPYLDEVLATYPDDWLALVDRGAAHFLLGNYDQTKIDLERVRELNPNFGAVYPFLTALALHDGDLVAAQQYYREVQTRYPDPTFIERLLIAAYGDIAQDSPFASAIAAFSSMTLLQWNDVVATTSEALNNPRFQLPEIYLIRGIAH
ncbi:MAG: protein kinase, partial [Anaerolineae bacterium]|nr:protein kinase [Anaerolineae bacterium]